MEATRSLEKERLLALLQTHGAVGSNVAPAAAWEAFKAYGREVAGQRGVGLLFQVGTYSFTGEPLFYFDPVCQFELVDEEEEHEGFEQLHCELSCHPRPELAAVEGNLWSFNFASAEDFYRAVEALPEFQAALQQPIYHLSVTHESV